MKKLNLLLAFVALQTAVFAQGTWKLDKMHSHLKFTVSHLSVSDVDGAFTDFDVTINTGKADFSDAKFTLTAKAASVNTGVDMRDNDLRSDHFFNVAAYPTISFTGAVAGTTSPGHYKLTGNLTIHGVTKPVTMDLWYRGTINNPMTKAPDAGFKLTGTLKRSDFGIAPSYPAAMIGDEIAIEAGGEFHQ
ncbi:MAG: YceI family protein [Mucilaginibacter sp.]